MIKPWICQIHGLTPTGLNDTEQNTSRDINTVGKVDFRKAMKLQNTF